MTAALRLCLAFAALAAASAFPRGVIRVRSASPAAGRRVLLRSPVAGAGKQRRLRDDYTIIIPAAATATAAPAIKTPAAAAAGVAAAPGLGAMPYGYSPYFDNDYRVMRDLNGNTIITNDGYDRPDYPEIPYHMLAAAGLKAPALHAPALHGLPGLASLGAGAYIYSS